jgi:hypothetical protein
MVAFFNKQRNAKCDKCDKCDKGDGSRLSYMRQGGRFSFVAQILVVFIV